MKKIRLTAFILSLASCLFLFSAGFSTWFKVVLPTGDKIPSGSGEFTAYSVVDVVSSGGKELDVSGFQYTSFGFVTTPGTISISYTFGSSDKVDVTLGYENLSGYANVSTFPGLFNQILKGSNGEGTSNYNYIKIDLENATFSEGGSSKTITRDSNTNFISSWDNPDQENGKIDEICYTIIPTAKETVKITYTFGILTTTNKGNFRQNLGKYLMAKTNDKTTFISTVVASSSAS